MGVSSIQFYFGFFIQHSAWTGLHRHVSALALRPAHISYWIYTCSCLGRSTYLPITRMPVVALPIGVFLVKMYWNVTLNREFYYVLSRLW